MLVRSVAFALPLGSLLAYGIGWSPLSQCAIGFCSGAVLSWCWIEYGEPWLWLWRMYRKAKLAHAAIMRLHAQRRER